MFTFRTTTPHWVGFSPDRRLIRWMVMCPMCGREWMPEPVSQPSETLHCRDCASELLADYVGRQIILVTPGEL